MMKIVKINKDRGYGDGFFKVIGEDSVHYRLVPLEGPKLKEVIQLFKCHCFENGETMRLGHKLQREAAAKIGRK